MSISDDDLPAENRNDLNEDLLLKVANFDLHSAGAFACLNKNWRDEMKSKLDVAKAFQVKIVREWKEVTRFANMANVLKTLHAVRMPDYPHSFVRKIEAEPVKFMECWWEHNRECIRTHRYLPKILMRALYGMFVATAICSVEKLERCKQVCTSVFDISMELLKVCGIKYIPDNLSSKIFLQRLAKLKETHEGFFCFDGAGMGQFDRSGVDRAVDIEKAFAPVFYRMLAMWKKSLPNPVIALVAHASASIDDRSRRAVLGPSALRYLLLVSEDTSNANA